MSIKEVVKDARLALSDRIKVTLREEILQNKVMNVARHLIIANHERQPRLQVLTLPGWHMVGATGYGSEIFTQTEPHNV